MLLYIFSLPPPPFSKWSQKKLELESTHPEILAILYTHIKKVVVVFLIDDQHNHVVFISMYTPRCHTTGFLKKVVEYLLSCFLVYTRIPLSLANTDMASFFGGEGKIAYIIYSVTKILLKIRVSIIGRITENHAVC